MKEYLRSIPIFSTLDDSGLDFLSQRLQLRHVHKGASVFLASEPGDCMYIIRSGLVKIISHYEGEERFILYLGPGDFFGEGAALFGGLHSASVYVVLDADLLLLSHDDLTALIERYPAIALTIIRALHQRLRLSLRSPIQRKQLTVIASIGDASPMLAQHLAQVTGEDVLLVDLGEQSHRANLTALREDNVQITSIDPTLSAGALPAYISQLVKQYYWVVLWAVADETAMTLKALNQADLRVVLGAAFQQPVRRFASDYLYSDDDPAAIHKLVRRLAQRQVGLALSSGNARGMAHIGVLKVLRDEKIPLDLVAGTSAGALFGALYCAGYPIEEMTQFALRVQKEYSFITGFRNWDFSLPPRSGIIKGNMFLKQLKQLFPGETFETLKIPLAVVAADLVSGEEIVYERGPLPEALRASMSMGGFLEPAQHDGRLLIDGGAVNPVPTQVLANRGMHIILASNVIPTLHDRLRWQRSPREKGALSLVDTILNEREIMEGEIIRSRMRPVDVVIQPDVARYHVRQYDKAAEIIRAGEEAAHLQIPYIRKLLAPRPRKLPSD